MTEKICTYCKVNKEIAAFYISSRYLSGRLPQCKVCRAKITKAWYEKNIVAIRKRRKLFEQNNPQRAKTYKRKLTRRVLDLYGGVCECCGERNSIFLTIDHKNNDGAKRRHKGSYPLYLQLQAAGQRLENFRILCYNCNCGRHRNGGVCPHQEVKTVLGTELKVVKEATQ